jgi:hypothetical protein
LKSDFASFLERASWCFDGLKGFMANLGSVGGSAAFSFRRQFSKPREMKDLLWNAACQSGGRCPAVLTFLKKL